MLKEESLENQQQFQQLVVPFIEEITIEDVMEALESMQKQKPIKLYEDGNSRPLIQIVDWQEQQTGLRYKGASHYDAPEGWLDKITPRNDGGKFTKEEASQLTANGTVSGTRSEAKPSELK